MSETHVNGMPVNEVEADEAQPESAEYGVDMELRRQARLSAMLRELVRQEGRMEAAELLGVNYKTVVRAEESGRITQRMRDALERLLGPVDDVEAARQREHIGELERRVEALEGGMESLATELRDGLAGVMDAVADGRARASADDRDENSTDEQARGRDGNGSGRSQTGAAPPVVGLRSKKRTMARRVDPEIVTEKPAPDDAEVYGAAWPLVEEWRRLRAGHPHEGGSLSWLTTQERLLALELAMLEEHGLTLPPEKEPLRGFGRRGQTTWRQTALDDTRKALRRRRRLRWARRILTLGLWWK